MSTSDAVSQSDETTYTEYIDRWLTDFKQMADSVFDSEKELYLIAISRKMPRFFSWLMHQKAHDSWRNDISRILSHSEYVTEHALPFLFSGKNPDTYEVIVVDDSMVLGNTLNIVTSDVETYTNGKKPMVSVIVSCKNACTTLISSDTISLPNMVDEIEISKWLDFVSRKNCESELPIDIVFPIIHFEGVTSETYEKECLANLSEDDWYILDGDDRPRSVNILLDDELVEMTSLDFSKSRAYFLEDKVKLAVFSPYAIEQSTLSKEQVFQDYRLNAIWNLILLNIALRGEDRTQITLIVVLNYLHAINTYRRNRSQIVPSGAENVRLECSDLQLIFGKKLTLELYAALTSALTGDFNEPIVYVRVGLPSMSVPKELVEAYDIQRTLLATSHMIVGEYEKVVEDLFDQARYDKNILGQNVSIYHKMHSRFFETFDSIENLLQRYYDVIDFYKSINKVMDRLIDEGKIIPKYIRVVSVEGVIFWRRYFTSAYSSVEL